MKKCVNMENKTIVNGFKLARPVRPAVIDIEASGFGFQSYPIEVGIVLASGQRLSRLIKPLRSWTHWDSSAEALHGISRDQLLQEGYAPRVVAEELNDILSGQTVYSDAWVVDKPWIDTLFDAVKINRDFRISPIEAIFSESQIEDWDLTKKRITEESGQPIHRALNDALLIQETFVATRKPVSSRIA